MNAEQLLQSFDQVAEAPDAVARLRQLILDLAIRGKLVEQDPNDEPGSEVLARIARAKGLLLRVGKPEEFTVAIRNEHIEVPVGWQAVQFQEILLTMQTGPFGSALHQQDYEEGGIPVINPASIQNERIVPMAKMAVGPRTLERLAVYKLKERDVVMGRRGEMGRSAVVTEREAGWLCGSGSLILRFTHDISPWFIVKLLAAPRSRKYLGEASVGATMQNLNQSILRDMVVLLPPLAEQHRIVAKVDELMTLCDQLEVAQTQRETQRDRLVAATLHSLANGDAGVEHDSGVTNGFAERARFYFNHLPRLTTHPAHIHQLRQTILNLAVRGKLVPQDPNDEPASELLVKLRQAKELLQNQESIRDRTPVERIERSELSYSIPNSWELPSFDDVFVIVSGVTKGRNLAGRKTIELPYLRVANVQRGYLDLAVMKTIQIPEDERSRYELKMNDILMTEGGDWDKLGRAAVWMNNLPVCIYQNHVFRVRAPLPEKLLPRWVITYANSTLGRTYFEDASKQTTNLASINMTQLRGCPLPLPPLAEQHRIVTKVDELIALCDELEAGLTSTSSIRRQLLEATLSEALNGRHSIA